MNPEQNIETKLEQLAQAISSGDSFVKDVMSRLETSSDTVQKPKPTLVRRLFMKPFTKLAAAAMIIIALGLFMHFQDIPFDGATKAYAMSDVPSLFHSAKSLHIKGKLFFPEYKNAEPVEIEHWIDAENSRWRSVKPSQFASNGVLDVYLTEEIFDGQNIKMSIDHRAETYTYYYVSPFYKNMSIHQTIEGMLQLISGQPEIFDTYHILRQESINDATYNLWEGVVDVGPMKFKMQSWLSPYTGQMAKAVIWRTGDSKEWNKQCEFDTIEMNLPIEDSIFHLKGPDGYAAENTIETAKNMGPGKMVGGMACGIELEQYFLFAIPQKCLIMCWRNEFRENPEEESQYFSDLNFGGPVPRLPAEVYALKTKIDGQEYFWQAKHLISTQKDGKYYEWALYIPEQSPPTKPRHNYCYTLVYRMNNDKKGNVTLGCSPIITIENQSDFEKFIIEATKELSDNSTLPIEMTLEQVMGLAADSH